MFPLSFAVGLTRVAQVTEYLQQKVEGTTERPRLVVNRTAWKTYPEEVGGWIERLRAAAGAA